MSDKAIYQALLTGFASAGITAPVNYPNMPNWVTPNNQLWVRLNQPIIGDNPQTLGSLGYNENQGSLQIDIFEPKHSGMIPSYDAAAAIKTAMGSGAKLTYGQTSVRIRAAATSPGNDDDVWKHTIISIEFTTFTQRGF